QDTPKMDGISGTVNRAIRVSVAFARWRVITEIGCLRFTLITGPGTPTVIISGVVPGSENARRFCRGQDERVFVLTRWQLYGARPVRFPSRNGFSINIDCDGGIRNGLRVGQVGDEDEDVLWATFQGNICIRDCNTKLEYGSRFVFCFLRVGR